MKKDRRKFDVREEYFVSAERAREEHELVSGCDGRERWLQGANVVVNFPRSQRLQATGDQIGELDTWENKRVDRLPGQAEWGTLPVAKK